MARPLVGAATHDQACCMGNQLWPRPFKGAIGCCQGQPIGVAAARGHGRLQPVHRGSSRSGDRHLPYRKGLSPVAIPTTSKGGDADRRGGRPLVGRRLVGKGHCR
ncbi:hypothetical protein GW17_00040437 [Ensete ventricosum]|nr:hypothetical protein GW17_00040437 [Ensete ventricosum]RZR83048.1 hypothetical protein BHM03_00009575 [Ensete ventricosum]